MTVEKPSDVVSDFNDLFNLVCACHQGPVVVDFGRQMRWDGIIAGQCTKHVQFLQADGINAFLDSRTNRLIFSEGTAETLHSVLAQQMEKIYGADGSEALFCDDRA
jgi:hypothetical protein